MEQQSTKFLHFRRPEVRVKRKSLVLERNGSFGGVTAAYERHGDTVVVAFARCRPDERYVKRIGRHQALEALVDAVKLPLAPSAADTSDEAALEAITAYVYDRALYRKNLLPRVLVEGGLA